MATTKKVCRILYKCVDVAIAVEFSTTYNLQRILLSAKRQRSWLLCNWKINLLHFTLIYLVQTAQSDRNEYGRSLMLWNRFETIIMGFDWVMWCMSLVSEWMGTWLMGVDCLDIRDMTWDSHEADHFSYFKIEVERKGDLLRASDSSFVRKVKIRKF